MNLLERKIRPRDIVTRKALENAAAVVAATGGSTNGALHLPAIAHEAGIDFDMHAVGNIFKRTPIPRGSHARWANTPPSISTASAGLKSSCARPCSMAASCMATA